MSKTKRFFVFTTLAIILIGCSQIEEGTFIQGNIKEINEVSGDMVIEIEAWTTFNKPGTSLESYGFEKKPTSQTIRIPTPEDYEEGQKVKVEIIKIMMKMYGI
ncbi:hypothetical protein [Piscibacillus salipiscarius]|uniref:hypothetical protein n=1 Tax=Piscibacillus salipiscarius TaxID=299480 RepID=UPI0006CF3D91|nr:hypothetical protein [Piscibacillus salipiscarius]